jgi:hypothetical protein
MKYAVIGGKLHYSSDDGASWNYKECPFAPMDSNDTIRPCGIKCALFDAYVDSLEGSVATLGCSNVEYGLTNITKKD